MGYTNRKEVQEALHKLTVLSDRSPEAVEAMSKIAYWLGVLQGFIGEEDLRRLEE